MLYFDNAATSFPKPECVKAACIEAFDKAGNPGRGAHEMAMWSARTVYAAREKAGQLLNVDPLRIVFTLNDTMALNEAISQVDGEILTTAMEHNSVLRTCHKRGDYRVVPAPDGELKAEDIISSIGDRTKAVVMSHASNLTGEIYDIGKVGEVCAKKGILFIVDAAQTAGVVPIDAKAMHIDLLTFSGHKGPLGPTGTGVLYVSEAIRPKAFMAGGTGSRSHELVHPDTMPDVLEAGTVNVHGLAGLAAGIGYVLDYGVERIYEHEKKLTDMFIEGIKDIPGMHIYRKDCRRVGTLSLNVDQIESADLCDWLAEEGVCVRGGAHCAPLAHDSIGTGETGAVRFSFGIFNTEDEIREGIRILKSLCEE